MHLQRLRSRGHEHLQKPRTVRRTFRMVYTGTLWRLTDIEPFVDAALRLNQLHPAEAAQWELHFAGRRTQPQDEILDRLATTPIQLQKHDYLPHSQSMQSAFESDALLLTLADHPGAERVVPAKMFEYMALNREILALLPSGEARDLISKHPLATCLHPNDTESIANWLANRIQSKKKLR